MKLLAGVKPVSDGWIALFKTVRIAIEDIDRTGLRQNASREL